MSPDPWYDRVLNGYRIGAHLGGALGGQLYEAEQLARSRAVVLKIVDDGVLAAPGFRERFERDARALGSFYHPHVVTLYGAGTSQGTAYLATRPVDGATLEQLVARAGTLDHLRVTELIAQVAAALDAAHERGLLHRGLSPRSILVREREGLEHAQITDFAIADDTAVYGGMFDRPSGTAPPPIDYAAPEQVRGEPATARTDVYALGAVLFHALTGSPPFSDRPAGETLEAHLHEPVPSVALMDELPAGFDEIFARALAKDPADRYGSASELAVALPNKLRVLSTWRSMLVAGTMAPSDKTEPEMQPETGPFAPVEPLIEDPPAEAERAAAPAERSGGKRTETGSFVAVEPAGIPPFSEAGSFAPVQPSLSAAPPARKRIGEPRGGEVLGHAPDAPAGAGEPSKPEPGSRRRGRRRRGRRGGAAEGAPAVEMASAAAAAAAASADDTADAVAESAAGPGTGAESAANAVAEPAAEPGIGADPFAGPSTKPAAGGRTPEPAARSAMEPATGPVTEAAADPAAEPSAEPAAEPSADPAAEPSDDPAAEPSADPVTEPAAGPAAEIAEAGDTEPVARGAARAGAAKKGRAGARRAASLFGRHPEPRPAKPSPEPEREPEREPDPTPAFAAPGEHVAPSRSGGSDEDAAADDDSAQAPAELDEAEAEGDHDEDGAPATARRGRARRARGTGEGRPPRARAAREARPRKQRKPPDIEPVELPDPPVAAAKRRSKWPLVAVGLLLLVTAASLLAASGVLDGDDGGGSANVTDSSGEQKTLGELRADAEEAKQAAADRAAKARADKQRAARERAAAQKRDETAAPQSWPKGRSAYTAVVYASATDREAALDSARRAARLGVRTGVLRSSDFSNLEPGVWVAYAGVHESESAAQRTVDRLRRAGLAPEPYTRFVAGR